MHHSTAHSVYQEKSDPRYNFRPSGEVVLCKESLKCGYERFRLIGV